MTNQTNEIEDTDLWPDTRLAQAELEIAEEKKRRAAVAAASQQAALSPAEREANSMRELGKLDMSDAQTRKRLLEEFGFIPWR
jgi:hypothetical protein